MKTTSMKTFLVFIGLLMFVSMATAQTVNMDRYVTLSVKSGASIKLNLAADEANTPVKIVSGTTDETITAGTSWVGSKTFLAQAETMTVYGNIKHFDCNDNGVNITGLDVSKNTELTELYCYKNKLTTLDVSKNTALTVLQYQNNELIALDISKNTALITLNCGSNKLTVLDVSKNTALEDLQCYNNKLSTLDVSKNTALTSLDCNQNGLTVLDVSKNTKLTVLRCHNNSLSTLDVSNNTELTELRCFGNKLTNLDISKNTKLTTLFCNTNKLITLDVSNNTKLTTFGCDENELTTLNVSKNTELTYLSCIKNKLTDLDVSKNTKLASLFCYENKLTTLDVSKNTELATLQCYSNKLTDLDVSNNTKLTTLYCYGNALSLLNLKKLSDIEGIVKDKKQLGKQTLPIEVVEANTAITIDSVFNGTNTTFKVTLDGADAVKNTDYIISGGNITFLNKGMFNVSMSNSGLISSANYPAEVIAPFNIISMDCYITLTVKSGASIKLNLIADKANTPVRIVSGTTDETITAGTSWVGSKTFLAQAETMTIYGDIKCFDCNNNGVNIIGLDVNKNTLLTELYCHKNKLTTLDVSNNTKLTVLQYQNNELVALDISKNTALITLNCGSNKLTSLDVSKNTALKDLQCYNNKLSALDISKNTALTSLDCNHNELTALDVSKNTALGELKCHENALSLLNLKTFSDIDGITQEKKYLGEQILPVEAIKPNTAITIDSVFNGVNTTFKVTLDDTEAVENTDYIITGGDITFLEKGMFNVSMTNTGLISNTSYPAKVIAPFNVKNLSSDATLAGITVSEGTLTPAFNSSVMDYTVNVSYEVQEITIDATTTDTNASVEGTGVKSLIVGENPFILTVTAEDGTMGTYNLVISRETNTTDIDNIHQEDIKIYPNPVTDYFHIKGITHAAVVSVYTMYGEMVLQHEAQAEENISVLGLPSGIYLITVDGTAFKVIKK